MKNTILWAMLFLGVHLALHLFNLANNWGDIEGLRQLFSQMWRIALFAFCIYGLAIRVSWGWWASVISSSLFGAIGTVGLILSITSIPKEILDLQSILHFSAFVISLLIAASLLLLPQSRRAFNNKAENT